MVKVYTKILSVCETVVCVCLYMWLVSAHFEKLFCFFNLYVELVQQVKYMNEPQHVPPQHRDITNKSTYKIHHIIIITYLYGFNVTNMGYLILYTHSL